jgi:glycosyltransferase involved in cell wall biosynthesis
MDSLRVLVVQNGARHNYAVPTVLARAGMLEGFYTDVCGNVGIGRWLALARHLPGIGSPLKRLHHRQVPSVVTPRTKSFVPGCFADALTKRLFRTNSNQSFVDRQMLREGLKNANLVYSSLAWGTALLKQARSRGIPVVTEFYLRPSIVKTYQDEFYAYPDWEKELPLKDHVNRVGTAYDPCIVSDYVIAPSEGVADDVITIHGFPRDRIAVVPYGIDSTLFQVKNRPIPKRVLFAGTCCLGKGIHYLAFAAERLARDGYRYEFRVAGAAPTQVRSQAACRHLTFLGRVPRTILRREYETADLIAIPSLSEGFSTVGIEGLAAGIPVITTSAAGTVVRNGVDGLIFPERDPEALANAIVQIVEDRPMREQMSIAARERASDYTWDRYGERLIEALKLIPNSVTYRGRIGEDRTSEANANGSTRHASSINIRQIHRQIALKRPVDRLRVLVAQNGARRNYAVPAVLAQAGMLEAFYTDICGNVGLGRRLSAGRHLPWIGAPLKRLYQRQIPAAVRQRATAFSYSTLADGALRHLLQAPRTDRYTGLQMLKHGLGNANLVYSFLGWGRQLLEEAKSRGIPVVTDFYVRPSIARICQEELRAYPGWESEPSTSKHVNGIGSAHDPCLVSDFVIVSGDAVADEVTAIHGFPRDRIAVVPLGVNDSLFQVHNDPVEGRVLFAGTCCLWKGIHYFAMAADTLVNRGHRYDFRVAGNVTRMIRAQPICHQLKFLDRVPRGEIKREYESADVLVFPTLADSFGIVQLEAMAAGIPVVTTRTAGSVVRHGIDGLIVPERDPHALADATAQIVEDRVLRERMSIAARDRARDYTWERYGERLIAALKQFANR